MTNDEIHQEIRLTLDILQAAESEAAYKGLARISGAIASGKNMIMFLSHRFSLDSLPVAPTEEQKECT